MLEQAREVRAEHGVGHEDQRDDGQRPAHGASRGFQQADQEDRAHEDGMYSTDKASAMAMIQSYSGMPPGDSHVDLGSRW
ncbi:hypothetical protein G6F68_019191 [Rhizopus microsporus]|uniref:Uncharacterized protein n=1 Tax=Rhizopus delemar TaxID=936053 RepID=A0A9P7C1D8_9FUNG|nr:hypothetical protein G6F68_019191 [Rhizopus microsporus]KAG1532118.1 hypothetical protein G6F50_016345 [Rhizopus delemar]